MSAPLPVHLITGLLGSGKTTLLRHLLTQKPANERWGMLINEFGDIDLDAATLQASAHDQDVHISEVSGGCVCCTAQHSLTQALHSLLQQPLDRLFIEPTGLGHPARLLDTLKRTAFGRPLALQAIVCVITPLQLTAKRWQKSAVMRDLVTLADLIVLNKTDQAGSEPQQQAVALLNGLYPPKTDMIATQFGRLDWAQLQRPHQPAPLLFLQGLGEHAQHLACSNTPYNSTLPQHPACWVSHDRKTGQLRALGWIFSAQMQFNRIALKAFFADIAPHLARAKGLLKTGNEWQLINWSDGQLTLEDIAWRQDSRLELLFNPESSLCAADLETQLAATINPFNNRAK